jgi:hypothetical protein
MATSGIQQLVGLGYLVGAVWAAGNCLKEWRGTAIEWATALVAPVAGILGVLHLAGRPIPALLESAAFWVVFSVGFLGSRVARRR